MITFNAVWPTPAPTRRFRVKSMIVRMVSISSPTSFRRIIHICWTSTWTTRRSKTILFASKWSKTEAIQRSAWSWSLRLVAKVSKKVKCVDRGVSAAIISRTLSLLIDRTIASRSSTNTGNTCVNSVHKARAQVNSIVPPAWPTINN